MEINRDKLDEIVLALLWLNAFSDGYGTRAWKGFDWDTTDRLYEKGYIGDPKSKAKSVPMYEEGRELGKRLFHQYFGISEDVPTLPDFVGSWHIQEMDNWDEDFFNCETQAYFEIQPNGIGDFQFGLVSGNLDGQLESINGSIRFAFTWEGVDELDPVFGRGWIELCDEDHIEGDIVFHLGDRSGFLAERVE
jgi:hypothetical protein